MLRIIAICGIVVGVAIIGYAVSLFAAEPPTVEPTAVVVEGAEVGEIGIGDEVPAFIRIHNNSNVAIRFIGGPNGCQPDGCIRTTGTCPLTISANSVEDIPLSVLVKLGSFRLTVCVYLDVAGVAVEREVYITGTGVQAAGNQAMSAHP